MLNTPITFLQCNLGRASHSSIEISSAIPLHNASILALQEPYNLNNSPVGFPLKFSIAAPNINPLVCTFFAPDISCTLVRKFSDQYFCVCELIWPSCQPLYLINCYLPPSLPLTPLLDKLHTIICLLPDSNILVLGDFNSHNTLWHSKKTKPRGTLLERFILENGLAIANTPQLLSTFDAAVGQSNIDLTLFSLKDYRIDNWRVTNDICSSDHNLITFNLTALHSTPSSSPLTINRLFFNKLSWKKIAARIRDFNPAPTSSTEISDNIRTLCSIASSNSSSRPCKNGPKIFWSPFLKKLRSNVRYLRSKFAKNHNPQTLSAFRSARNSYCAALRKAKLQSWNDLLSTHNGTWNLAYRYCFKYSPRGHAPSADLNKLSLFNSFTTLSEAAAFETLNNLFPPDCDSSDSVIHTSLRHHFAHTPTLDPSLIDHPISSSEISAAIKSMRPRKATGPDGVPLPFLKFVHILKPAILQKIYGFCYLNGLFPSEWKSAKLILIKKKSPAQELIPKFRPISLLSIMGKIYEKVLLGRLFSYVPEDTLISPHQYGFKRGKSTIDALFNISNLTRSSSSKYVCAIFLDIEKAFDAAWWPMIYSELSKLGIPPNLLLALKNFLADREIILKQGCGEFRKKLSRGCPQGSVLSPVLWNILVNSLLRIPLPLDCHIVAYADDITLLISASSRRQIEASANTCLSKFSAWATDCKLRFSAAKSKGLLLRGALARSPLIKLDGTSIKFVKEFKYLGLWLAKDLNFVPHVRNICQDVQNLLPSMANYLKATVPFRWKNLLTVYKQGIVPKISYGIALWGSDLLKVACSKRISALQRSFLIRMTKAFPTSPGISLDIITLVEPLVLFLELQFTLENPRYSREPRSFGNALVNFNGVYHVNLGPNTHTCNKKGARSLLSTELFSIWNKRWTSNSHPWTGRFFPDLNSRRAAVWFQPSPIVTQFLTGHCNVRAYLTRFNLRDDDLCDCGIPQTAEHELVCPDLDSIKPASFVPDPFSMVSSESAFQDTLTFLSMRNTLRKSI